MTAHLSPGTAQHCAGYLSARFPRRRDSSLSSGLEIRVSLTGTQPSLYSFNSENLLGGSAKLSLFIVYRVEIRIPPNLVLLFSFAPEIYRQCSFSTVSLKHTNEAFYLYDFDSLIGYSKSTKTEHATHWGPLPPSDQS